MSDDGDTARLRPDGPFFVVGIGASAGGIPALRRLFSAMPPDTGMAFVVILHLSEHHESNLPSILQATTSMPVNQVTEATKVEPDHVYVIPPAKHLRMSDGEIQLADPESARGQRVPIDVFFRSLAQAYGKHSVGIVLSGTGTDGTLGLKRVKEHGGFVLVQEPAEAEYDSMPRSAIETKLADVVLPVKDMPQKLVSLRDTALALFSSADQPALAGDDMEAIREVLSILRLRTGHDFTTYKQPTLLRRIARRLQVHGIEHIPAYIELLRSNPGEVQDLLRDLLISVTNFFRDKEAFDAVEQQVIPRLFKGKDSSSAVRVWVPGCATGEEAYSITILLCEFAATLAEPPDLQVFATDIDEEAITVGRESQYDKSIAADLTPERLRAHFVKSPNGHRIKKDVREKVLFAPHNVLRDPPFSRLDLIACRNLLIYLDRETQQRLLEVFRFALRSDGYLFLGSSESADIVGDLFVPVDKKYRIYRCSPAATYRPFPLPPLSGRWQIRVPEIRRSRAEESPSFGELHHRVVEKYAPPSILINREGEVVHVSEHAAQFLRFAGGEPSRELFKIMHPALRADVRVAILAAREEGCVIESRHVAIELDGAMVQVSVFVHPVPPSETAEGFLLLVFEQTKPPPEPDPRKEKGSTSGAVLEAVVRGLEQELDRTRDRLRSTVEEHETSVEELKASNEELQAINEELRSATEELETGKEELQSVNEELTTVNHELKLKVDEVSRAHADLQNLMSATDIGTIFLDKGLRIKRFTPFAQGLFNLIASDIDRPLSDITSHLSYADLPNDADHVLSTLQPVECEVQSTTGHWFLARCVPYRTLEDRIDGVVLTFIDISRRKRAEQDLAASQQRLLLMLENAREYAIFSTDLERRVTSWNVGAERLLGYQESEIIGEPADVIFTAEDRLANAPAEECTQALREGRSGDDRWHERKDGSRFWSSGAWMSMHDEHGKIIGLLKILRDDTERRCIETELRESKDRLLEIDRRKDEFLATLSHELRNPLAPMLSGLEVLKLPDLKPAGFADALAVIDRQVEHMVRLVDDLLEVSRITQGKVRLVLSRLNLVDAVSEALESAQVLFDRARHRLSFRKPDAPLWVEGDMIRLTQVFYNLLGNASKFTPAGGEIAVETSRQDGEVVVVVRDTGIGIAPEVLPFVFDMFRQDPGSHPESPRGLGIGLTVVKQFVELHHGTVEASSEGEGRGAAFTVRLPLSAGQLPKPARRSRAHRPVKTGQVRILVVDDNHDAADFLKILLAAEGHDVQVAYDGIAALAAAEGFRAEVVFLDIGLPQMNGWELARTLRARSPGIFLVALSGWGQEQDRQRSKASGFDEHLVKPISIEDIREVLERRSV